MPFQKGNQLAKQYPQHGTSVRELIRNHPMRDKRKLVEVAFSFAIKGDVRWAEWITKHAGEGFYAPPAPSDAQAGTTVREIIIRETRHDSSESSADEAQNDATDAPAADYLDASATLLPSAPSAPSAPSSAD